MSSLPSDSTSRESKYVNQSLRNYLQAPNPVLIQAKKIPNGSSTGRRFDYPKYVYEWDEFEDDTLNAFSDGELKTALDHVYELIHLPELTRFAFRRYGDEKSLTSVLGRWTHTIIDEALRKSQEFLNKPREPIYMVNGGLAESTDPSRNRAPDWAATRSHTTVLDEKERNLLPGDTKLSSTWSSRDITPGRLDVPNSRRWAHPIGQIFTYCIRNNTRYGYLITDAELLAVRIRIECEPNRQPSFSPSLDKSEESILAVLRRAREGAAVLDYKAIPWKSCHRLTVNLALWWLHILATGNTGIGDKYCALKDEEWGLEYVEKVGLETVHESNTLSS